MKHTFLTGVLLCLLATTAWATDVSVTETFTGHSYATSINTDINGDLCIWHARGRRKDGADYITVNSVPQQCWYIARAIVSATGQYIQANWDGGIKSVKFRYAQYGKETDNTLKLQVTAGTSQTIQWSGLDAGNGQAGAGIEWSHDFKYKSNGTLSIRNTSEGSASYERRILIGDVTITPYIFYQPHCKQITLGLKQKGFKNYLIDNTEGEGTITYSSSDESKATVDEDGFITPLAVTDKPITITASWEDCTTSYSLTIISEEVIVENFSKIGLKTSQLSSEETWEGDFGLSWKTKYVRRAWSDTLIGVTPRTLGTLFPRADNESYFEVYNIEGGIKHFYFNAKQVGTCSCNIDIRAYYAASGAELGKAVAQLYKAAGAEGAEVTFNYDIDTDGSKGTGHLRFKNASAANSGVAIVIPNIQITPWLLYTTKECTLNMRGASVDPTRTFTNNDLINNTDETVTYSITNYGGISTDKISISSAGTITVADRFQTGDITVQAVWSEVTTTYTLHVIGKTPTSASFANSIVRGDLNGTITNNLAITPDNYDGTVTYSSSNTDVATFTGSTINIHGVGVTTITATLPETANFQGTSASYTLYITDANARKETFAGKTTENDVVKSQDEWVGQLYTWQVLQVRRYPSSDTIWNPTTVGTWIRTSYTTINKETVAVPGYLQSKDVVEGGIKHLSFYWKQWAAESGKKLRLAVYAGATPTDGTRKEYMERDPDSYSGSDNYKHEKFLFGANNVMQSNARLIIRNESYIDTDEDGFDESEITTTNSRMIIDAIHITPYLLYTTKDTTLDMRQVDITTNPVTFTNDKLTNNTEGAGEIEYSIDYSSGDLTSADVTINASNGTVTVNDRCTPGTITVQAHWTTEGEGGADVTTTYDLTIIGKTATTASFPNAVMRVGVDSIISNALATTSGYDGTVAYASSNTSAATVSEQGAVTIVGVGRATITATLPETANYTATSASFELYIRDENAAIKEHFKNIKNGTGSIEKKDTVWTGVAFDWNPQGAIRHNASDTIWGTGTNNRSVWIATTETASGGAGVLGSKYPIEGGIKHLSFYWKQWAAESDKTLRMAVFANSTRVGFMEYTPNGATTNEKFLFGVNDIMRAAETLYIKNESFTGATFDPANITTSDSRIVIDTVFITPWLRYMDKAHTMRVGDEPYTHPIVDNTGGSVTYSLIPANTEVASINSATGEVTALKAGIVTVQATWTDAGGNVTTTYHLTVKPQAISSLKTETFPKATAGYYSGTETNVSGDQGTWYALNAGININDVIFSTNAGHIRAPYTSEGASDAYIKNTLSGGIHALAFDWNLVGLEDDVDSFKIVILINGEAVDSITNAVGGMLYTVRNRLSAARAFAISDLDVSGDFELKIENRSTMKDGVTYTSGNKARFILDNIEWVPLDYSLTVDDAFAGTDKYKTPAVVGDEVAVSLNRVLSSPIRPAREGYTFGGYYTDEDGAGTQVIDANGAPVGDGVYTDGDGKWKWAGDLTVYAKWADTHVYAFEGGVTDHEAEWNQPDNWTRGVVPTIADRVCLWQNTVIPTGVTAKAAAVQVMTEGSYTPVGGSPIEADGKLTVEAGGVLLAADRVIGSTATDILLESDGTNGTGALITGNPSTTAAGVEFYTKARREGGYVNQFIGVPLAEMNAHNGFFGTSLYSYDADEDSWELLPNNGDMYPFRAYNLIRKESTPGTLYMEGVLNLPGTSGRQELEMGSRKGDYLFANSWTAPIDVASIEASDFTDAEATIYIFNAGTKSDYDSYGSDYSTKKSDNPGQWLYMPVAAVKASPGDFSLTVIPSMQAFMLKSTDANASLTLNYDKHVYSPAATGMDIVPNRAPQRTASENGVSRVRIDVVGTSGCADNLLVFAREDFQTGFDNGWEAQKVYGETFNPQLYAMSETGNMAIAAVPDIEGTVVGFKAGTEDAAYTFNFDYDAEAEALYLLDTQTDTYTPVLTDNTYSFTTTDKKGHARFLLTRNAPAIATGLGDTNSTSSDVRKRLIEGRLYIIRDGRMYSADGQLVQ